MRTVEDRDLAVPRSMWMHSPEEVMGEFNSGGLFEAGDARALRVEGAEHMIHRAILPTGIERLQNHEDRVLVLGVEQALLACELLAIILRLLLGFGFRCVFAFVGGIELVQLDLGVRVGAKLFAIIHAFLLVPRKAAIMLAVMVRVDQLCGAQDFAEPTQPHRTSARTCRAVSGESRAASTKH